MFKYIFCEMPERAGISDNAGGAPSFEFSVNGFKDLRREPEAIQCLDVVNDVVHPDACAIGCQRIEMVAPEIADPGTGGQTQHLHESLSGTLAPSALFGPQPDLSG